MFKIKIFLLILVLPFISCDIMKQSAKSKGESSGNEQVENHTFRKGDTVHFSVPKITFKDTTIYKVNRQGTTIATQYDNSGNIRNIDCFSSAVEEISKQNREFFTEFKDKAKVKEEKFDSTIILYIMGGIVILGIVALFFLYRTINKNSKAIDVILSKIP
ncbi:MAG: hypothetical protein H7Z76_10145 [Methylotenera sp.]|nr:hypothetical protein [Flavobacterium sp.]